MVIQVDLNYASYVLSYEVAPDIGGMFQNDRFE